MLKCCGPDASVGQMELTFLLGTLTKNLVMITVYCLEEQAVI